MEKYPDIQVELHLTDQSPNIIEEGYDAAIHVGPVNNLSVRAYRIFESSFHLVASPDYLKQRGTLKSISHLSHHDCVIFGKSCTNATWNLAASGPLKPMPITGRLAVNHLVAVHDAVAAGFGIGLLPLVSIRESIQEGRMLEVLPKIKKDLIDVSITWVGGKYQVPSVQAFVDYIKDEFSRIAKQE